MRVPQAASTLIRIARERSGLSQDELGRRTGIARTAIGRWERGEVEPSFKNVAEVLEAAGWELRFVELDDDDHDRSLITQELARTPAERLDRLGQEVRAFDAMAACAARSLQQQASDAGTV